MINATEKCVASDVTSAVAQNDSAINRSERSPERKSPLRGRAALFGAVRWLVMMTYNSERDVDSNSLACNRIVATAHV